MPQARGGQGAAPLRYPWLLFDADDTLFDYRCAEAAALREAFGDQGIEFDADWLPVYQRVNATAWQALESGLVTPDRLRVMRFEQLFAALGLTAEPAEFSAVYLGRLAAQTQLVDGALEVVTALRPGRGMAIITNGLADVQRPRIARSTLAPFIDHLVISEELGVAKPDPAFFATALGRIGRPAAADVLVIGDSLSSDIAGGAAAGLDTCWFNPDDRPRGDAPAPTYEIRRLADLAVLVAGRAAGFSAGSHRAY